MPSSVPSRARFAKRLDRGGVRLVVNSCAARLDDRVAPSRQPPRRPIHERARISGSVECCVTFADSTVSGDARTIRRSRMRTRGFAIVAAVRA